MSTKFEEDLFDSDFSCYYLNREDWLLLLELTRKFDNYKVFYYLEFENLLKDFFDQNQGVTINPENYNYILEEATVTFSEESKFSLDVSYTFFKTRYNTKESLFELFKKYTD